MGQKLRVTFTELNQNAEREFRYYPVSDFETAKTILHITISELSRAKEVNPNMYCLEVWDKEEDDWLVWESEDGRDITDVIYEEMEEENGGFKSSCVKQIK
ncbi:hypothetical protein [Bacillus sp. AK128]